MSHCLLIKLAMYLFVFLSLIASLSADERSVAFCCEAMRGVSFSFCFTRLFGVALPVRSSLFFAVCLLRFLDSRRHPEAVPPSEDGALSGLESKQARTLIA
jgi:hypothetical protein